METRVLYIYAYSPLIAYSKDIHYNSEGTGLCNIMQLWYANWGQNITLLTASRFVSVVCRS